MDGCEDHMYVNRCKIISHQVIFLGKFAVVGRVGIESSAETCQNYGLGGRFL